MEESGCPAAEMELFESWCLTEYLPVHRPFFEQGVDIGGLDGMFFGDAFVATTKCTEVFAKGQVDVETDAFFLVALCEGFLDILSPEGWGDGLLLPVGNGWVGGVPRARDVVFSDEL